MATQNMTNGPEFAVWIREGLTTEPFILADEMTREEADLVLGRIAVQPGGAAGIHEYLPGEWSDARLRG